MATIFVRKTDHDPFEITKDQVVTDIKSGKLLADDEISLDGQSWLRLDRHKQLGALFNQDAPQPQPKSKAMSESIFYSSDRVNCPNCGYEQDRGDTCLNCYVLFEKYWKTKKARAQKKSNPTPEPEVDTNESGNFIHKLWNGKYPLWEVTWLFGLVYPMCTMIPIQLVFVWKMQSIVERVMSQTLTLNEVLASAIALMATEMKTYFMVFAAVMLVFLVYGFILNVGLWKSANNYTGASIWRILIKVFVIIYFIMLPFSVLGIYQMVTGFEEHMDQIQYQFQQMKL